jgi:hypothetical protein
VQLVVQGCRRRVFHLLIFPRACLRQTLALYYVLTRLGYVVEIHFGIQKAGHALHSHSWVTVQGKPVVEQGKTEAFRVIYSFPTSAHHVSGTIEKSCR